MAHAATPNRYKALPPLPDNVCRRSSVYSDLSDPYEIDDGRTEQRHRHACRQQGHVPIVAPSTTPLSESLLIQQTSLLGSAGPHVFRAPFSHVRTVSLEEAQAALKDAHGAPLLPEEMRALRGAREMMLDEQSQLVHDTCEYRDPFDNTALHSSDRTAPRNRGTRANDRQQTHRYDSPVLVCSSYGKSAHTTSPKHVQDVHPAHRHLSSYSRSEELALAYGSLLSPQLSDYEDNVSDTDSISLSDMRLTPSPLFQSAHSVQIQHHPSIESMHGAMDRHSLATAAMADLPFLNPTTYDALAVQKKRGMEPSIVFSSPLPLRRSDPFQSGAVHQGSMYRPPTPAPLHQDQQRAVHFLDPARLKVDTGADSSATQTQSPEQTSGGNKIAALSKGLAALSSAVGKGAKSMAMARLSDDERRKEDLKRRIRVVPLKDEDKDATTSSWL